MQPRKHNYINVETNPHKQAKCGCPKVNDTVVNAASTIMFV
jgi:hypothetical protein